MALSWILIYKTDQYVEELSDHRLEKPDEEQDFFIYQYNRTDHRDHRMHDDFSFYHE
jgi:hypothetical protein